MNILTISSSQRSDSQSLKVSKFLVNQLRENYPETTSDYLDLFDLDLPMFDPSTKPKNSTKWQKTSQDLQAADGLILVVPEWGGMVTPILKNFLLYTSPQEVGNKPVLLVAVSAGRGGAYPISELRSSGYKNNHLVYIPDHLIIRGVENILNQPKPEENNSSDIFYHHRIQYSLAMLIEYSKALRLVRESGVPNYEDFGNGM